MRNFRVLFYLCLKRVLFQNFSYSQLTFFCFISSPNTPGSGPTEVTWPKFTEQEQAYLVLGLKPRVEHGYKKDKVAFWNEIIPKVAAEFRQRDKKEHEKKFLKDEL